MSDSEEEEAYGSSSESEFTDVDVESDDEEESETVVVNEDTKQIVTNDNLANDSLANDSLDNNPFVAIIENQLKNPTETIMHSLRIHHYELLQRDTPSLVEYPEPLIKNISDIHRVVLNIVDKHILEGVSPILLEINNRLVSSTYFHQAELFELIKENNELSYLNIGDIDDV